MEALDEAASGRAGMRPGEPGAAVAYGDGGQLVPAPAPETHSEPFVETPAESHAGMQGDPYAQRQEATVYAAERFEASAAAEASQQSPAEPAFDEQPLFSESAATSDAAAVNGDLDGARLVALNIALNGDSREDTGRYLEENFAVPDRERLLDEV